METGIQDVLKGGGRGLLEPTPAEAWGRRQDWIEEGVKLQCRSSKGRHHPTRSSGAGRILLTGPKLEQGSQVFKLEGQSVIGWGLPLYGAWLWVRQFPLADAIAKEIWGHRAHTEACCLDRASGFSLFLSDYMCGLPRISCLHFYVFGGSVGVCIAVFNILHNVSFWVRMSLSAQLASFPYYFITISPKIKPIHIAFVHK